MPSGVYPKIAAHCRVGNHETDGGGNLIRPNETLQLRLRQDLLPDVLVPQDWTMGVSVNPG